MSLFSAIGNAVSSVSDAFESVVDSVAGDNSIFGGIADAFNITDIVEFASSGPGALFEKLCDTVGLPEWCGDISSGIANAVSGNWVGLASDVIDISSNVLAELGADQIAGFLEHVEGIGDVAMDAMSGDFSSVTSALDSLKDIDFAKMGADLLGKAIDGECSFQDLAGSAMAQLRV